METLLALMEGLKGAVLSAAMPGFDWITFLVFMTPSAPAAFRSLWIRAAPICTGC